MKIEHLIGDYQRFFFDILQRLKKINVSVPVTPLSHLTYRIATLSEYENLRDELKMLCSEYVETQFNGRAVAILILKQPLILADGFSVSMIELPAPRAAHMYPSGLESVGFILGENLPEFIKKQRHLLTGIKDHGQHCQPAFITFDNEKTVKFYDISLREIVKLQGWAIEKLTVISLDCKI